MLLASSPGSGSLFGGFSVTNTMPAFEAFTNPLIDKPGKRDRVRDAGLLERDRRHLPDHRFRAIQRGARRAAAQTRRGSPCPAPARIPAARARIRGPSARSGRRRGPAPPPRRAARAPRRRRRRRRALKKRLNSRKNQPNAPVGRRCRRSCGAPCGSSSRDASAGLSVSELNAEITVEIAIVNANCR